MKFSAGSAQKIDEYIIEFTFDKDVEVDQSVSVELLNIIMNFSGGKPHSLLYNFNGQNIISSEIARKFSAPRNYANSGMIARAIVAQSLGSTLEASHYVKNSNPTADTCVFDDREKAIAWLQEKARQMVKDTSTSELKA